MTPGYVACLSTETLGSGAHRPQKSPSASPAPGRGNRSEFQPGCFPAPPQRPCQGVGANPAARPFAGASAEGPFPELAPVSSLLQVSPAWLLTPFGWFPETVGHHSRLAAGTKERGGSTPVPLDPLCKELPATPDFTFTHRFLSS